ncbi:MAG TPA: hypothetical protein VHL52_12160 [Acidimicrobiia bacterium]|nr:hypothetical protein [Acidimicrobiia bacterium]
MALTGDIHRLGAAAGSEWPREYARLVRIPVNLRVDSEQKIFDGAGTVVDTLKPYLVTMASGVGGRLRAVLAGFGH